MSNHTATPWKAVPNGGDDPDTRALLIGKDDQYGDFTMIAETRDFFGEVDGDQEANAAFIVQACNAYDSDQRIIAELRAALEVAREEITERALAAESYDLGESDLVMLTIEAALANSGGAS